MAHKGETGLTTYNNNTFITSVGIGDTLVLENPRAMGGAANPYTVQLNDTINKKNIDNIGSVWSLVDYIFYNVPMDSDGNPQEFVMYVQFDTDTTILRPYGNQDTMKGNSLVLPMRNFVTGQATVGGSPPLGTYQIRFQNPVNSITITTFPSTVTYDGWLMIFKRIR